MKKKYIIIILLLVLCGTFIFLKITQNSNETMNTIINDNIDWSTYEVVNYTLSESITITKEGIYNLTGTLNGNITINTKGNVKLILNNVTINNDGPAIYVQNANITVIETEKGTINTLSDSNTYNNYEDEIEGTIYSKDNLVLEGNGTLIVKGNKGDAIVSKDCIKINGGSYNITSASTSIKGKDSVYIVDGNFIINSSLDGIKSTKGYVQIDNGEFTIVSVNDSVQAETNLLINNGTFNITAGGGSKIITGNKKTTIIDSSKGLKAVDSLIINGGSYNLDTLDDALHSNNYLYIKNASLNISTGDDGIHSDKELVIDSGTIKINKSYEGIESENITINGGDINIISNDDGINAAGDSTGVLTINNGNIYVNASGDGLDANGSIYVNGGTITVDGPTNNGNGALDYDSKCIVKGGTLIAAGSSGMAQGISSDSTQYGLLINFTNTYNAGTKISILDSNDNEVISYTPSKTFSSIVFSITDLKTGTYKIMINDEEYQTVTISSITTTVGSVQGMGGNPGMGGPGMGDQPRRTR